MEVLCWFFTLLWYIGTFYRSRVAGKENAN